MSNLIAEESRQHRAEQILRQLRQRMERHLDQQNRLNRAYQGWQECWFEESERLERHLLRLEAHLATWFPTTPPLTIVGAGHD